MIMLPVATCHPESRLSFYCDSVFADKVFDYRPSTKWLRATTRSTTWTKSRGDRTTRTWRRKRSGRRWILRKVDSSNLFQPPNLQLSLSHKRNQICETFRHVGNHVPCHRNHHRELYCYDSHRNHCSQGNLLYPIIFYEKQLEM